MIIIKRLKTVCFCFVCFFKFGKSRLKQTAIAMFGHKMETKSHKRDLFIKTRKLSLFLSWGKQEPDLLLLWPASDDQSVHHLSKLFFFLLLLHCATQFILSIWTPWVEALLCCKRSLFNCPSNRSVCPHLRSSAGVNRLMRGREECTPAANCSDRRGPRLLLQGHRLPGGRKRQTGSLSRQVGRQAN